MVSYEIGERTVGIGAYEDDCAMVPSKLPFGFTTFNKVTTQEARGSHSAASVTWSNAASGTSTKEVVQMLDQIEQEEKEVDPLIGSSDESKHLPNVKFEDDLATSMLNLSQTA